MKLLVSLKVYLKLLVHIRGERASYVRHPRFEVVLVPDGVDNFDVAFDGDDGKVDHRRVESTPERSTPIVRATKGGR